MAGFGSVVYGLTINTISHQMGFQNGLYAFTAAVLGGIGNITGAVLGGLVIGLVRMLGSAYIGETWTSALVFAVLTLVGFGLVLAGAVLPFLMVIHVLPSPLWLSVVAYASSVSGLFLGIIGAAMIYAERRRDDGDAP